MIFVELVPTKNLCSGRRYAMEDQVDMATVIDHEAKQLEESME